MIDRVVGDDIAVGLGSGFGRAAPRWCFRDERVINGVILGGVIIS